MMSNRWLLFTPVCLAVWLLAAPAQAEWGEQTLHLQPGWNAVFLEVEPDDNACAAVFKDAPIESVWFWNKSFTPGQFVRDPANLVPESPDWLTYFPVDNPKSFLTDLHAVLAGKCYLIENGSSEAFDLTLTGRVLVRKGDWLPDALNLVGFHVSETTPPSFANFFDGEKALEDQAIYRINADGMAEEVSNKSAATMKRGEAYWVFCKGESTYTGPIAVESDIVDGLQFGEGLSEQALRITNESDVQRTVTIKVLPAVAPESSNKNADLPQLAGPVALTYLKYLKWEPLNEPLTFILPPGSKQQVELGVRRAAMQAAGNGKAWFGSILEVSESGGQTYRIPVSAEKNLSEGGLWAGTVTVSKVSEAANPTNVSTPTPAAGEFTFRIIVHVDDTGAAKLLQSVAIMQVQPVTDSGGTLITPARYVLITDEELIPQYTGVSMRDGAVAGRRITAPSFAFGDPIPMTAPSAQVLEAGIVTANLDPRNPFLHRFHPDHDNLNERYDPIVSAQNFETYDFTRTVRLEFEDEDPDAINLPSWGYELKGGTYRETISGVHRNDIVVEGTFQLSRVSDVLELNDGQ
jgi:hypothetical protein